MSTRSHDAQQSLSRVLPTDAIGHMEEDLAGLRALTLEERGLMLKAACSAAARLERSKVDSGLPPSEPDPWPDSTWRFLKEHASNAKRPPVE